MSFAGLNYLAILVAAAAGFAFGAVWYGMLGQKWMRAAGISEEDMKNKGDAKPFLIAAASQLIMAFMLAGFMGHMIVDIKHGLITAGLIWLGFVVTSQAVNYSFQMRPTRLILIDSGHWLGVLLIMGVIIGWFGT